MPQVLVAKRRQMLDRIQELEEDLGHGGAIGGALKAWQLARNEYDVHCKLWQ